MKIVGRISIGGWIFVIHFSCVAIVFLLPVVLPQPHASITSGDHWYWSFLDFSERLFFWITLPVSFSMSQRRDAGLYLFDSPITEATFVPFCVILALNSLLIGYMIQLLVWALRRQRVSPSTVADGEEFRRLLEEHRRHDAS